MRLGSSLAIALPCRPPIGAPPPGAAPMSFPAQGARYDLDWAGGRHHAGAPMPSNASAFAAQPDDTANSNDGRFFRQLVTPNLPVYAERMDGSLRRFGSGSPLRRTDRGLLVEPIVASGEQPILWTNDLTQAAWLKNGVTAALNQTSRSGAANSGTLLMATAAGGTILYPVTLAASTRNLYADLKRVAGTGTIEMTLDGGATWTAVVLDRPRFDGWGRYGLPRTAVINPGFGFRMGTVGDQIAVAFVTSDLLPFEGSPWDQSGSGRRRVNDRPSTSIQGGSTTSTSSGLMDFIRSGAPWGVFIEWDTQKDVSFLFGQIIHLIGGGVVAASTTDSATARLVTPANTHRPTMDPRNPLTNRALFFVDTATGVGRLSANGSAVVTGGGFTAYTTLDHKDLGSNGAGTVNMAGYIRRLVVFADPPTDGQMRAWTSA